MLNAIDVAEYLGISDTDNAGLILSLIRASEEDLRKKVGRYDENSELAALYQKYWIGCIYADRYGELNNKTGSAVKQAMENILFTLRLEVQARENHDNES